MKVNIEHIKEKRFSIKSGSHEIIVDLPASKGGTDKGMSPLEVFLGSLGACVAVYANAYCQNAKIPAKDFSIKITSQLSQDKPARFSRINVAIDLGVDLGNRKEAFLNFVKNCPIHNTIASQPEIKFSLAQ